MLNLKVSNNFNDYTLVSVSSWYQGDYYQVTDIDGTPDPLIAVNWGAETEAVAQDLRIVSNYNGSFNFIAGLYYGNEDVGTNILHEEFFASPAPNFAPGQEAQILLSNGTFGQISRKLDVEKESLALYTDMNGDISQKWGLNLSMPTNWA